MISFIDSIKYGWNLGNSLESYNENGIPNETAWGNPTITKTLLSSVKQAGFNVVRCPISWMNAVKNDVIDSAWLSRIYEVVNWIIELDMKVIINIHHDGNNDFNHGAWLSLEQYPYDNPNWSTSGYTIQLDQNKIRTKFKNIWQQIAEKFQNIDNNLIFEGANELMELYNYNNPISQHTIPNLNTLNQLFVDTIRAGKGYNSSRYLIVPGYNTNIWITTAENGYVIPKDINNKIIISLHYYDPWDFTLNEQNDNIYKWGDEISNIDTHVPSWGGEAYLMSCIQQIKTQFLNRNIPVLIGEFGCIDKSHVSTTALEYERYFNNYVFQTFSSISGVSACYWDNGNIDKYGFAIFNRNDNTVYKPSIVSSITSESIAALFSRRAIEVYFNNFITNPKFNSDLSNWKEFKNEIYNCFSIADKFRDNITQLNLSAIEKQFSKLVDISKTLN